jgi:hypothetical protein
VPELKRLLTDFDGNGKKVVLNYQKESLAIGHIIFTAI